MDVSKKTKNHFTVESHKRCINCNRPLKKNLTDKIPNAQYDYVCYNVKVLNKKQRFREKAHKDVNGNTKSPIDLIKKLQQNIKKYK
jgi:hypothetical protein